MPHMLLQLLYCSSPNRKSLRSVCYAHHWHQGLCYCVVLFSLMSSDGFPGRQGSAFPQEHFSLSLWWYFGTLLLHANTCYLSNKLLINLVVVKTDVEVQGAVSKSLVKSTPLFLHLRIGWIMPSPSSVQREGVSFGTCSGSWDGRGGIGMCEKNTNQFQGLLRG